MLLLLLLSFLVLPRPDEDHFKCGALFVLNIELSTSTFVYTPCLPNGIKVVNVLAASARSVTALIR